MKEIELSRGKVALVDDSDYDWLNQWKWHISDSHGAWYAKRQVRQENGKQKQLSMHNVIMGSSSGLLVDHVDRNGLNNQRSNLRLCTRKENTRNREPKSSTGYLGVYVQHKSRITAVITVSGKRFYLGSFKTIKEAVVARDNASKKHFGEFANINFKTEE